MMIEGDFGNINVQSIEICRDDLYERVWQEPMSRLAPQYGITDVGLKKICKKLSVPTPPQGYWVRLEHGYKDPITPLPKLKNGEPSSHTVSTAHPQNFSELSEEAEKLLAAESESAKSIAVLKKLTSSHPLVLKTREALSSSRVDKYGVLRSYGKGLLKFRVSPKQLPRALRIMDALVKGFETRGFPVSHKGEIEQRTYTEILGEKIRFSINEKVNQLEHIPTEKEKKEKERHSWERIPKWDFIPSGVLSLVIENWLPRGLRKTWSDGKSKDLEEWLNDFVVGAIKVADSLKKDRLDREEQQRQWQEELRKRDYAVD